MQGINRTNRTNRFIASIALTTTVALGLVALPGIASATPTSTASSITMQQSAAAAAPKPAQTSAPVTGTVTQAGVAVPFAGTISNLTTSVVNGVLTLTGTLTGTGLPGGGVPFSVPLAALVDTSCSILTLDIGAIHLDLLGLVVDLAPSASTSPPYPEPATCSATCCARWFTCWTTAVRCRASWRC